MKEYPILFSTEMVKAILEGRKMQTRRIIKPQPPTTECKFIGANVEVSTGKIGYCWSDGTSGNMQGFWPGLDKDLYCPYGQPGDRLWVREKWRFEEAFDFDGDDFPAAYWFYASTPELVKCYDGEEYSRDDWKWRPSIHMPKTDARIWLEIEEVKVERVQDISEEDILNEGIQIPVSERNTPLFVLGTANSAFSFLPAGCLADGATPPTKKQILFAYWAELWCKINGRESWDSNPWVWVIKFKVLKNNQ